MQSLLILGALGLASYRATQLIVWDSILDGWRKKIELWRVAKFDSRFRKFVWDLISCTYCTGFWLSVITTLTYLTAAGQWGSAPLLVHAIECWIVAGVQALANRWDDSRPGHEPEGN